jgi:hypothetical protein
MKQMNNDTLLGIKTNLLQLYSNECISVFEEKPFHILNHRIIVASFVCKGSRHGKAISNDGFFFFYQ